MEGATPLQPYVFRIIESYSLDFMASPFHPTTLRSAKNLYRVWMQKPQGVEDDNNQINPHFGPAKT